MDLHGYREEELVDSGSAREVARGFVVDAGRVDVGRGVGVGDDKRDFEVFAAELDGAERSRSWSRGRGDRKGERVPKQFF